jgi:hypothetical protein
MWCGCYIIPVKQAGSLALWQIKDTDGSAGFGVRFGGQDPLGREINEFVNYFVKHLRGFGLGHDTFALQGA